MFQHSMLPDLESLLIWLLRLKWEQRSRLHIFSCLNQYFLALSHLSRTLFDALTLSCLSRVESEYSHPMFRHFIFDVRLEFLLCHMKLNLPCYVKFQSLILISNVRNEQHKFVYVCAFEYQLEPLRNEVHVQVNWLERFFLMQQVELQVKRRMGIGSFLSERRLIDEIMRTGLGESTVSLLCTPVLTVELYDMTGYRLHIRTGDHVS